MAYDTGVPQLSSSAKVTVIIINVNDEDPKFEKESYKASVKENSQPGTRVTVVKAIDADEGPFGEVTYSLIGEHASDFNIGIYPRSTTLIAYDLFFSIINLFY